MYDGSLVMIYLESNQQKWQLIGGMHTSKFILNSEYIDCSNVNTGSWRQLINGGGLKKIDINVSGIFTNNSAEQAIRKLAFLGEIANYKISFSSGENLVGKFQVSSYERIGNVHEPELYSLELTSSGEIYYS